MKGGWSREFSRLHWSVSHAHDLILGIGIAVERNGSHPPLGDGIAVGAEGFRDREFHGAVGERAFVGLDAR
jgi:hypothetical protein